MTLSYSRHGPSNGHFAFVKFVFDQSTATWLRLHREGFEYLGGVPGRIMAPRTGHLAGQWPLEGPLFEGGHGP